MAHLWLVRLGRHGEEEPHALAKSELVLGFKVGDLSKAKNRDAILAIMPTAYPDKKPKTQLNFAAQLNQFCNVMQRGDLVVVPLKTKSQIAIAQISGPYADSSGKPSRSIKWLKVDLPRSAFKQDLLFSFGAFMTVCEISRNDALSRVQAVLKTGQDPGYEGGVQSAPLSTTGTAEQPTPVEEVDLDQIGRDQIERYIASHFTGHDLTWLVGEILKAQGYLVNVSPPGPDKGIDIVAGRGPLGLEAPRLVVQVKSGKTAADQPTLQALIGSVQDTKADHGLLASWAGFTPPVEARKNELFFRIRFWGRAEIIDALLEIYDRLSEEIRAELPLRQIWALVPEEEDD